MPKKKSESSISPDAFKRVLGGMVIDEIDVEDFSGKVLYRRGIEEDIPRLAKVKENARFEHLGGGITAVFHTYRLTVDNVENAPHRLFDLSVTFRLSYACQEEFDDDFFAEFKRVSLRLQTAPFARSWIQDHCLRMGVPPLIMPLLICQ